MLATLALALPLLAIGRPSVEFRLLGRGRGCGRVSIRVLQANHTRYIENVEVRVD